MRIFICGLDGYLGWPLALHLTAKGHAIGGADCFLRRAWVEEAGGASAFPISPMATRLAAARDVLDTDIAFFEGDLTDYGFVEDSLARFEPDAIVHLGEMPSAPYSMMDCAHAVFTHRNNLIGTLNILFSMRDRCPEAHLVKLGTMGEYGTPNLDIPEGFFTIQYRGRTDTLPFPKQAGSWYHQTKVHDSNNIMFACRIWGLRSTDLMQGVVYGTSTKETRRDPRLATRFDFDGVFGTAINRFCAQAVIGHPLTPYGKGGQRRGFIYIEDSMRCMELAIENPPAAGEYRVFNQLTDVFQIDELAERVRDAARDAGLDVSIQSIGNPRIEKEEHYYNPDHRKLLELGLQPHAMADVLPGMLEDLMTVRPRIEENRPALIPRIYWSGREVPVEAETAPGVVTVVRDPLGGVAVPEH